LGWTWLSHLGRTRSGWADEWPNKPPPLSPLSLYIGGLRWHRDGTSGKIKLPRLLLKEEVDVDVGFTVAGEKMSW